MDTQFLLTSTAFSPTPGEHDDGHDDFINLELYALDLADFLARELGQRGYPTGFRCQEDWGHWLELVHDGRFTLAVCCANTGESVAGAAEHRVFLAPDKPVVRRFFKKINVQSDVESLAATLKDILQTSPLIADFSVDDGS